MRITELDDDDREGLKTDRRHTINRLLFPGPTEDFDSARQQYGDLAVVPTSAFFYGLRPDRETEVEISEGNLLLFGVEAIGDADERGMRNVLGTINGQMRPIEVRDRSVDSKVASSEKADIGNPQHVSVPFAGVVNPLVAEGDTVEAGQTVATIEAMKMEAAITSANAGTVERLGITDTRQAEGGDLLLVLG